MGTKTLNVSGGDVLINEEDFVLVKNLPWSYHDSRGALANVGLRSILMHRLIMGVENDSSLSVRHKNGNKWDNRRENLEIISRAERLAEAREARSVLRNKKKGKNHQDDIVSYDSTIFIRGVDHEGKEHIINPAHIVMVRSDPERGELDITLTIMRTDKFGSTLPITLAFNNKHAELVRQQLEERTTDIVTMNPEDSRQTDELERSLEKINQELQQERQARQAAEIQRDEALSAKRKSEERMVRLKEDVETLKAGIGMLNIQ